MKAMPLFALALAAFFSSAPAAQANEGCARTLDEARALYSRVERSPECNALVNKPGTPPGRISVISTCGMGSAKQLGDARAVKEKACNQAACQQACPKACGNNGLAAFLAGKGCS